MEEKLDRFNNEKKTPGNHIKHTPKNRESQTPKCHSRGKPRTPGVGGALLEGGFHEAVTVKGHALLLCVPLCCL